MKEQNSLTIVRDYGKVVVKLKQIMDEKKISRYALARNINVRFEVVDRWYNGNVEKMDLDILARICFCLSCKVEDLLVYENFE